MDQDNLIASTPLAWVALNKFKTENQKILEFRNHRFMIDPFNDMHPEQVYIKSAQVGGSVMMILKTLWMCNYMHTNIGYVLPSQNIIKDFVTPKVDPLISSNKVITDLISRDSVSLKQIGDRFLYFRGAFSDREAIAISLDVLVLDELDRMPNQTVINTYDSRLQASEFGYRWRLSNPSVPGYGVHELYMNSDQRHWFVKCTHCGHNMFMDYEASDEGNHYIDKDRAVFACGKCAGELSDTDRRNGEWVAKWASRSDFRHGYWMSQLIAPWVSAKRIIDQADESSAEFFYNFVLGKPYQAADLLIDRDSILKANHRREPVLRHVVMGSDIGKPHWYWLATPDGFFKCGQAKDWEELEYLFRFYQCEAWVMDSMPEFTKVAEMMRKYPGKAFAAQFNKDRATIGIIRWQEGDKRGYVYVDRTKIIDRIVTEINNQDIVFLQDSHELETFIAHASNMYRTVETDTKGLIKIDWQTKEGRPDHLLFALIYCRVALEQVFSAIGSGVVETSSRSGQHIAPTIVNGKMQQMFDVEQSIENAHNKRE